MYYKKTILLEKNKAMLKAIIIDDEPNAIENLQWELRAYKDDIEILESFINPINSIDYIHKNAFDILFLDIEMPQLDGFQLLQKINLQNIYVVITTAYNSYAIKAFKHNVIDYLLKPIDEEDLRDTILKITDHYNRNFTSNFEKILTELNNISSQKKIILKNQGKLLFYNSDEISHAISDGNYTNIYFSNGTKLMLTKKLKEIETILFDKVFLRVHNSYIINTTKITSFIIAEHYLILEKNIKIPVSKAYKDILMNKL